MGKEKQRECKGVKVLLSCLRASAYSVSAIDMMLKTKSYSWVLLLLTIEGRKLRSDFLKKRD